MRRFVAIAAAGAVMLGGVSVAEAQTVTSYAGSFEPSGVVRFDVHRSNSGKKTVVNFKWARLPLACESGPETTSSRLNFTVRVDSRRFSASAVDDPQNPGSRLELEGELMRPGRAAGTMRISGERVPVDQGPRQDCNSGRLSWTARVGPSS